MKGASKELKTLIISSFTANNLAGYLNNDSELPPVNASVCPFNQVMQILMDEGSTLLKNRPDVLIIWTQPESVIDTFRELVGFKEAPVANILSEVDTYCSLIRNLRDKVKFIFVPTWAQPSYCRVFGVSDMKYNSGISNILMRMNLRLSENFESSPNVCILNSQKWAELVGKSAYSPKLWYMAKIPFGNQLLKEAAIDIRASLRGFLGMSKKLIIVDLDDTLWGGVVGDVGWANLRMGGHDPIGEAFSQFQRVLKGLTNRGVLLAIVSKNEESVALEAIQSHPEMALKLDDFVSWRINWDDKARNIADLVSDLNLGLQSVLFIDDSPFERARVRESLPEVYVPDWPADKMLYASFLLSLKCFEMPSVTNEDAVRTKMYIADRKREDSRRTVGSLGEWLKTLGMKIEVEALGEANLQRTTQLLNKTNQMNLSTRRMSDLELNNWVVQDGRRVWTIRVCDKHGDLGLVGIISVERQKEAACITDFVLSCRAMGRQVEEAMVYVASRYAKELGLEKLTARYLPTAKNKPCLDFWRKSGFSYSELGDSFSWELKNNYLAPEHIEIVEK